MRDATDLPCANKRMPCAGMRLKADILTHFG